MKPAVGRHRRSLDRRRHSEEQHHHHAEPCQPTETLSETVFFPFHFVNPPSWQFLPNHLFYSLTGFWGKLNLWNPLIFDTHTSAQILHKKRPCQAFGGSGRISFYPFLQLFFTAWKPAVLLRSLRLSKPVRCQRLYGSQSVLLLQDGKRLLRKPQSRRK